jgi:hypothetical protein
MIGTGERTLESRGRIDLGKGLAGMTYGHEGAGHPSW